MIFFSHLDGGYVQGTKYTDGTPTHRMYTGWMMEERSLDKDACDYFYLWFFQLSTKGGGEPGGEEAQYCERCGELHGQDELCPIYLEEITVTPEEPKHKSHSKINLPREQSYKILDL